MLFYISQLEKILEAWTGGLSRIRDRVLRKRNGRLEIPQWSYTASPEALHIGPIAEEFFDLFGYGLNGETISPRDIAGVALAAVKALKSENVELQQRIAALEARNGL